MKNVSEETVRRLKAEAARRGVTLSEAVEEAVKLWLNAVGGVATDEVGDELAWERVRRRLEKEHRGKYAVIARGELVGVYESLEEVSRVLSQLRRKGVERALVVHVGVDREGWVGEWLGGSMERIA